MPRENRARAIAVSENRFGAVFFTVLIVLAVCAALVGRARGDDFLDRVQALEARNAQAQTDPAPLNRAPQPRLATPEPDRDTYDRHGRQPAAKAGCGCINCGNGAGCPGGCHDADCPESICQTQAKACPTCGGHCTCTPEDGCGDRDCPAVPYGRGLWLLKAGLKVPAGYRWNAVEGRAFRPVPKAVFVQPAPVYFTPPPVFQQGFGGGFNGGGGGRRGGSC